MRKAFAAVVAACLVLLGNTTSTAENDPTHALTMIVPFPADRATDALGRYHGGRMRPILGQSIIIENVGRDRHARGDPRCARPLTATRYRLEPRPRTC